METFDRAPAPRNGSDEGLHPSASASAAFPVPFAQSDESDQERQRRQEDLASDEELAMQLAAQLRMMSPAEHTSPTDPLPRVGDSRDFGAPGDVPLRVRDGTRSADDSAYGVEYHALDSDGEDAFAPQPRPGYAPMICEVLTGMFRVAAGRCKRGLQNGDLSSNIQ